MAVGSSIRGCARAVPVIIMPGIHVQLEGVLNISKLSVRISRADLPRIVDILRGFPAARVVEMQAELAKVWERFTYSALFKREIQMQSRPPNGDIAKRVGTPPPLSDQKSHVFRALEPRLRGLDAAGALVEHLRQKLEMRCTTPRTQAVGPAALSFGSHLDENGEAVPASYPAVPLIDHGPPAPPLPAVRFHVWTSGVV